MDYPESNNWYTHCLYNRRVDGVVAISQKIADLLLAAGVTREKIWVIASGIEPQRFMAARPTSVKSAGELVIGSVGVLEERKGHGYLLEAAGKLKRQGSSVRIRIAGDGCSDILCSGMRFGLDCKTTYSSAVLFPIRPPFSPMSTFS